MQIPELSPLYLVLDTASIDGPALADAAVWNSVASAMLPNAHVDIEAIRLVERAQ